MNQLYRIAGISKQAVNQYAKRQLAFDEKVKHLVIEAEELRREHPGCGVEKNLGSGVENPGFWGRTQAEPQFCSKKKSPG